MNESELRYILARNPAIRLGNTEADLHQAMRILPPPEPERREENALDPVVQGEETRQTMPVIRFIFYRTRLVDADAVHAGAKDLLDGLVEAGLIPGDREDQIDFDAKQVKVSYKKDERTEIELTLS